MPSDSLTPDLDERLASALAAGKSPAETAQRFAIDEWCILDRLAQPAFRQRIKAHQAVLLDAAAGGILEHLPRAILVLHEALLSEDAKVRRRAAAAIATAAGQLKVASRRPAKTAKEQRKDTLLSKLDDLERRANAAARRP